MASASERSYCSSIPPPGPRAARAVPDVPLVVGDADRLRDALVVAGPLDERRADPDRALGLVRLEDVGVVVGAAGVDVDAVVVDDRGEPSITIGPIAPAVLTAADQLDRGIGQLHDLGELAGLFDVVLGGMLPICQPPYISLPRPQ